ncbi:hypothetical protein [Tardiphaga sp.]|uniref:hypothetical protein n=1 Tax=Tardiphaga sp. TaxID=1926292 RepID=UPI00261904E0|nr:hypothetical protein [Tardiphaga sp.]MDB5620523.1 hypothetical protein [Tardiphaga sp.]
MTEKTEAEKAQDEATRLAAEAAEAQAKANEPEKTPEQIEADRLTAEADDAKAKAAELKPEGGDDGDTSVAEAKIVLPVGTDPDMPAGDYRAVKRGNDPANPEYAAGVSTHEDDQTVKLSRVTADSKEPIYTWVHPDMVGNYLRAGWGRE